MNTSLTILRRNIFTIFFILAGPLFSLAQSDKREARNHGCKVTHRYSADERLKNYPFGQAAEIRLVSFSYKPDSTIYEHRLPELNGKVDLTKMDESITLDKTQIDLLTHILFNVGYRGKLLYGEWVGCYNPRNAILFVDSSGSVFEFFEICFECNVHRLSSGAVKTGEFCSEKYSMIKDFFIKNGIEIGTIRGMYHP